MPMKRVGPNEALSRSEFHLRLREWFTSIDEEKIGDAEFNQTAWIHVLWHGSLYYLNSDSQRRGVDEYLRILDQCGEDIEWSTVPNSKGRMNAIAYGPNQRRVRRFYLYKRVVT